jgi:hypothetical protein
MTTLAIMKARIAEELRRDDLTGDIADAISSAIGAYQNRRFYFNETRSITFTTVESQDIYTSSDDADIANIIKFDYVFILIGGHPYQLQPMKPADMESANMSTSFSVGQPAYFSFYNESIRLYPIPAEDGWTVRIGAQVLIPEPSADAETGNAWMVKAERLIRSRAKMELYTHVIKDMEKAQTMKAMAGEALKQLIERTQDMTQVGPMVVEAWDPY